MLDADYGSGVMPVHKYDDGSKMAIAHAPRFFLSNESSIEMSAIIFIGNSFLGFFNARGFCIQRDHRPLLSIYGFEKGIPSHTANRLQRRSTTLLN